MRALSKGLSATIFAWFALVPGGVAQSTPAERTFAETPARVQEAIQGLHSSAGRLPVLDGFVVPGNRALERYQRGYYQCTIEVSPEPTGGSRVHVSARITAWYADPDSAKSGYQVLTSNGRIESDFMDRLEEALSSKDAALAARASKGATTPKPRSQVSTDSPTISAPMPGSAIPGEPIGEPKKAGPSSPFSLGTSDDLAASLETRKAVTDKHAEELKRQAKNLEEILRNQAHPTNLVVVKSLSTPVLLSPSQGAKVVFLASAEDEFEILDTTESWVHVRISGLSRGWIRKSEVEIPGVSETQSSSPEPQPSQPVAKAASSSSSNSPFQIENEQIASFPGDWAPLHDKTVKIVSVQAATAGGDTGPNARLNFAKSLFDREYTELTQSASTAAGVVVIFDSADGGMLATTMPVLQQWKAGTLSDEALWRRCYFDPPINLDVLRR